jgi:hypothetical protein
MNCPRCRTVAPAGAGFCPSCGNDLRAFQAPKSPQPQPVNVKEQMRQAKAATAAAGGGYYQNPAGMPAAGNKSMIGKIIGTVMALLLIGLGIFAFNVLKSAGKAGGNMLGANGKEAQGVLADSGTTDVVLDDKGKVETVLKDTGGRPKGMPEDIHRWLEHLEKTERKRAQLSQSNMSKMMQIAQTASFGVDLDGLKAMATGDPDTPEPKLSRDEIAEASETVKAEWAELKKFFQSLPPPSECVRIADPYTHAIDETGAMIGDVLDSLALAQDGDTQTALKGLYGMQNASKSIDQYGRTTDDRVGNICDKYSIRKWFNIQSDYGNSNMLGSFGSR